MKLKSWADWKEGWKNNWYNRTFFILVIICFGSSYGVGGLPDFDSGRLSKLIWSAISLASGFSILALIIIKEFWLDHRKKNNSD